MQFFFEFAVINEQAEKLKKDYGSTLAELAPKNQIVTVPGINGRPSREISFNSLSHVIQARMEEIIGVISFELESSGYMNKLGAGIVITGGGSLLKHLPQLISFKTGLDVKIGYPNEHLAGNTDTYSSDYRCNDIGTRNLLECLKGLGPKTHFVHISTTAIMSGRLNCKNTFNENATPVPTNNYGFSKLTAETLVQKSCLKHGFKLSIIRYPTVYGKDPRKNSFFDYLKGLIEKNSPLMRLNWPGLSSFVHVDDAAKSVLLMLDKPPKPRRWEIFNVSTESLTLKQISILLYNKMKLKYKPLYLPKIIWRILTQTRPVIYKLENYLSPTIYNSLWRATLLIDNVIFCNASKLENTFSQWKPLLLSDKLDDVI
ncbi:MAG: Cell division protein ftsA [Candidatus Woesebacteria bacterium GW2011_GWE2_31_6]|nr:MAG: Cell division protein ftsA [Candidatus Woesebacteria bacterium GW2011_GWE2_31_6]